MPTTPARSLAGLGSAAGLGLGLALTLSLVACGSSDSASVGGASASADSTATFCDTYLKIDRVSASADTETPAGAKSFAKLITPDVDRLTVNAPDALVKPVATLAKGVAKAKGGDPSAFQDDAFNKAASTSETWMHGHCNYRALDVTGVDYAFNGLPKTTKAGKTSIAFKNSSTAGEPHLALVLKPKAGVDASLDELLALPQDQAQSKVDVVAAAFAPPGQSSGALVDLKAGTYYVICPLPVGGKDDGAPHFTRGMSTTLTVK